MSSLHRQYLRFSSDCHVLACSAEAFLAETHARTHGTSLIRAASTRRRSLPADFRRLAEPLIPLDSPSGTFTMGSPTSEASRDSDEVQHVVTISRGFWMGKYLVTQGEYL